MPSAAYGQNAASFLDFMRDVKPAHGILRGACGWRYGAAQNGEQLAEGIELPEEVMNRLRSCGEKYGVAENL